MHIVDQGWSAPGLCAGLLGEHLADRESEILDVGAGTGLVGLALRELGYSRVDGFDLSPERLDQARVKGAYRAIHLGNAERMEDVADASCDAVVNPAGRPDRVHHPRGLLRGGVASGPGRAGCRGPLAPGYRSAATGSFGDLLGPPER